MFLNMLIYKGFVALHFFGVKQRMALLNTLYAYLKLPDAGCKNPGG
jgi:hypothetical protein